MYHHCQFRSLIQVQNQITFPQHARFTSSLSTTSRPEGACLHYTENSLSRKTDLISEDEEVQHYSNSFKEAFS